MSIFLNVVGLLSLIGGVALFFSGQADAGTAGAAVLEAALCFGLARIIELQTAAAARRTKAEAAEEKHREALLAAVSAPPATVLPPPPGAVRYHFALGASVQGPHDAETLLKLVERDAIPADGHIIGDGWTRWLPRDAAVAEIRRG